MIVARTREGQRVMAEPGLGDELVCPECREPVLAKCGPEVVWHFAHTAAADGCSLYVAGGGGGVETRWHAAWKRRFWEAGWDVEHAEGRHRADAYLRGAVVEFHSGALDDEVAAAREAAWGPGLVWVLRGRGKDVRRRGMALELRDGARAWQMQSRARPVLLEAGAQAWLCEAFTLREWVREDGSRRAWYEATLGEEPFTPARLVNRLTRRAMMFGPDAWGLAPARTLWLDRGWEAERRRRAAA